MSKIKFLKNEVSNKKVHKLINNISMMDMYTQDDDIVKKFKFELMGDGCNASVYKVSSTKIIRIEHHFDRDGYFSWLKYCLKNQHLKSIPKIFLACLIKDEDNDKDILITVTERLIPIKGSKTVKKIDNTEELWNYFMNSSKIEREENIAKFIKNFKNGYQNLAQPLEYQHIRRTFKGINDLHSNNMMLSRDKKRFVITDPIC